MFTWCRKRKADMIFLQETHSKEDSEKQWANEWGGKAFFSHGSPNSCGVAILIRNNFNCAIQKSNVDPQGRFIILKADIQDKVYTLVNIYAPNKDKVSGKFYKNLHRALQTEDLDCEENIIIGGDFNCSLDPKLDKKGGVMVPRKVVIDNIECLQNELDLVKVWRIKNPQSTILDKNVKKNARCMFNFRILPSKARLTQDTPPSPQKNNVEVWAEHFCCLLNNIDQGGVGEGSTWCQVRRVGLLCVRKSKILNTFCPRL